MKQFIVYVLFILIIIAGRAMALEAPQGPVLLTISGGISQENIDGTARFDRTMLESLPQHSMVGGTPWTDGVVTFSGPLLRDVLALAGATGDTLHMTAANGYQVDVPAGDARKYEAILAMTMNGETLTVRTKGPLWLIYPWDKRDELRTETYYSRSIWQLIAIEVR